MNINVQLIKVISTPSFVAFDFDVKDKFHKLIEGLLLCFGFHGVLIDHCFNAASECRLAQMRSSHGEEFSKDFKHLIIDGVRDAFAESLKEPDKEVHSFLSCDLHFRKNQI